MIRVDHVTDGTSHTYLFGEKYLNPDNYTNGNDASDNENAFVGFDNDLYRGTSTSQPSLVPHTPCVGGTYFFGSAHPTGVQFVFCDGSVHLIAFSVDPT